MKNGKWLILGLLFVYVVGLGGCYSCRSYHEMKGTGPVDPAVADKPYWHEDCRPLVPAQAEPLPAKRKGPVETVLDPIMPKETACGRSMMINHYPCSACRIVKVQKDMPEKAIPNNEFDYVIEITNVSDMPVVNVELTEHLSENFKFASAEPSSKVTDGKAMWKMDMLEAGESAMVKVTGMATKTGCIKNCSTIDYDVPVCTVTEVVQPELMLQMIAPSKVMRCDPIEVKYVVSNGGTGMAEDVKVEQKLPSGLMTADGGSSVMLRAGDLKPGQSKEYTVKLNASKADKFTGKALAMGAGGLKADSGEKSITIVEPVLKISKDGPKMTYLGKMITYQIKVTNSGSATAENLVIEDMVPNNVKFVRASDGGQMGMGKVTWKLGSLAAGASRQVSAVYQAVSSGKVMNKATASAYCAAPVTASSESSVEGIAAVLLEVIDVEDPIEVGNNETYIITATNQGTADATNVKIVCTIEDNQSYVSSSGATRASVSGSKIEFAPLGSLAPKAKATWRVVVKAEEAGSVLFGVKMTLDQIDRPVDETESTRLYE